MSRKGPYFMTYSGRKFYPQDVREEDVDITDITMALSKICRFGGHTKTFYSVAEHSVLVMGGITEERAMMDKPLFRAALLHDAAEAYLGDVVRPNKSLVPEFKATEKRIMDIVEKKYKCVVTGAQREIIKDMDNRVLVMEARTLLNDSTWTEDAPFAGLRPVPEPYRTEFTNNLDRCMEWGKAALAFATMWSMVGRD